MLAIVEGCADADAHPKPPWHERKERYIAHLATADASVLLVSAADRLHNARSILANLRRIGDSVFTESSSVRSPKWSGWPVRQPLADRIR